MKPCTQETPVKIYAGRSPGMVVKCLNMARDEAAMLVEMASSRNNQGAFVGSLVRAEYTRREERLRLRRLLEDDMRQNE